MNFLIKLHFLIIIRHSFHLLEIVIACNQNYLHYPFKLTIILFFLLLLLKKLIRVKMEPPILYLAALTMENFLSKDGSLPLMDH